MNPPSSSDIHPIPKTLGELQKDMPDLKFIVAVDGKGNQKTFRAPDVTATQLPGPHLKVEAKTIDGITSNALVRYTGSNCIIWESTDGGQSTWYKFCW